MTHDVAQQSHDSNASKYVLGNAKHRESKKPCKSSWISHWMPSGNNFVLPVHKGFAVRDEGCTEYDGVKQRHVPVQILEARKLSSVDIDVVSDNNVEYRNTCKYMEEMVDVTSSPLQSSGVQIETRKVKITDEGFSVLRWNLKNLNSTTEAEKTLSTHMPKKPAIQIAELPDQWMKRYKPLEKISVPSSRTFQDDLEESTSSSPKYGMLDESKFRKSIVGSSACTMGKKEIYSSREVYKEHFAGTNFTHPDQEHCNSSLPCHGQILGGNFSCPIHIGQQGNKTHNCSDAGLVELKRHRDLLQRMPTCSVHDVETFRLSTIVDSVEGVPGGPSKFSKTTHQVFFTKKTGMNFPRGNQAIIDSTHSSELEGNIFHDLVDMPPVLCCCCKQESMYQSMRKSSSAGFLCEERHNICCNPRDSMEEGSCSPQVFYSRYSQCAGTGNQTYNNANGSKCPSRRFPLPLISGNQVEIKQKEDDGCYAVKSGENELTFKSGENESAHVNILLCQSNNFTKGVTPSLVQKDPLVSQDPTKSLAAVISPSKEGRSRNTETHLPDKNEELPSFSGFIRSADDRELSPSKTESLDAEHLLLHVDRPDCSNSSFQQNRPLAIDSNSRWVKRLRSSSLETQGTKSLDMGDISSAERGNKLFRRLLNCNTGGLEPKFRSSLGKGHQQLDKAILLSRASLVDSQKGRRDATLSHSWIKRWCRGIGVSPRVGPAQVICKPNESKVALEEVHGKQFPSIAAMALMGKAVRNFQPCEYRKSGSLVVWNTAGY